LLRARVEEALRTFRDRIEENRYGDADPGGGRRLAYGEKHESLHDDPLYYAFSFSSR
jgi:hypothetical protein